MTEPICCGYCAWFIRWRPLLMPNIRKSGFSPGGGQCILGGTVQWNDDAACGNSWPVLEEVKEES